MSFTKTISVFAALASIFGAGAAGWKLAQDSETKPPAYEQKIEELQQEISTLREQNKNVDPPAAVTLPPAQVVPVSQLPKPVTLPQPSTLIPAQSPAPAPAPAPTPAPAPPTNSPQQ